MKQITKKIAVLFLAVVMTVAFVPQSLLNVYAEDAAVTASSQEENESTSAAEPKNDPAPAPDPTPSSDDSGSSAGTPSGTSGSDSQEPTSATDANQDPAGGQGTDESSAEKSDKDSSAGKTESEAADGQEAVESDAEEVVEEEEPMVSAKAVSNIVLEYGANTTMSKSGQTVLASWGITGDTGYVDAGSELLGARYRVTNRNTSNSDKHVTVTLSGLITTYETYHITLHPKKVNVKFMLWKAGDSSFSEYDTQTLYHGGSASFDQLDPVTKDGVTYNFYGWYSDEACKTKVSSFTVDDKSEANVVFYAKYAPEVKVTYHPNSEDDGVTVPDAFTGGVGTTVELSDNASRPGGWELESWNTEADGSGTSYGPTADFTIPDSDTELYAQWVPHMVTITYVFPFGQNNVTVTVQDTTRQTIIANKPNPPLPVFVFMGWSRSQTGDGPLSYPEESFTVDGNMTFYATWGVTSLSAYFNDVQLTGNSDTRIYNGEEQSVEGITAEEGFDGEYYTYLILGPDQQPWLELRVDCRGIIASGTYVGEYSTPLTAPIDVYAHNPLITIDIEPGTIVAITAGFLHITPADLVVKTESAKKKYDGEPLTADGSLEGIYSEDATIETTGSQTEVGESQNTYKLHWKDTNAHENYTITEDIGTLKVYYEVAFDANGGSGAPASLEVIDTEATLPSDKPSYSGHDFLGWATSADAESAEYQPGDSIPVNDHMTLYAVWEGFSYSFTAGDGQTWTKETDKTADFTVKRSSHDDLTFEKFTGVSVDGNALSSSDYVAGKGSVNLSLAPAYLETLAVGQHTITANFEDGSASASFTIVEPPVTDEAEGDDEDSSSGEVATGDDVNLFCLLALMVTALLGLIAVFFRRRHEG